MVVWACASLSSCVWLDSFVIIRREEQAFFILNYNTVIMVTICAVIKHYRNACKYLLGCCVGMATDSLPKGRKTKRVLCKSKPPWLFILSPKLFQEVQPSINIKLILSPLCPTACPCSLQARIDHHPYQKMHGGRHTKCLQEISNTSQKRSVQPRIIFGGGGGCLCLKKAWN